MNNKLYTGLGQDRGWFCLRLACNRLKNREWIGWIHSLFLFVACRGVLALLAFDGF